VFDELVKIVGDESTIKDLTQNATPTVDTAALDATATVAAVLGTVLPTRAGDTGLSLPVFSATNDSQLDATPQDAAVPLPTFTFPANLAPGSANVTSGQAASADTTPSAFPPIMPIILLGGLGVVGLVISSSLRRK
jgi:hypothetical protein